MADLVKIGVLRRRLAAVKKNVETDPNTAGMNSVQRKKYDSLISDQAKRRGEQVKRNIEFIKKNPNSPLKFDPSSLAKKKDINVDEERELKRERDHSKRQRSIEQG